MEEALGELFNRLTQSDHILASYQSIKEKFYNPYLKIYSRFIPGIDGVGLFEFDRYREESLDTCQRFLGQREADFHPLILRRIPKESGSKYREIYLSTLRDRVIQKGLAMLLAAQLDRHFYPNLYSYRKGKYFGTMPAARKVRQFLTEHPGPVFIFKTDVKDYFDSMDHCLLLARFRHYLQEEPEILNLLQKFLRQRRSINGALCSPLQGITTGSSLSPLCANLYLIELDQMMFRRGFTYIRYGDDIIILATTRAVLTEAHALVKEQLEKSGLVLSAGKTVITTAAEPFDYLGYRFENGHVHANPQSIARLQQWLRKQLVRYRYRDIANRTPTQKRVLLRKILRDLQAATISSLHTKQIPWLKGFPIMDDDRDVRRLDHFIKNRIRLCVTGQHSLKNYREVPERWFREDGYRSLTALYYCITRRKPLRSQPNWQHYAASKLLT